MKIFPERNIRYLIEFIVIISGVFLSFYLDDMRQLGEKKEYRETLIGELVITANEDLDQLNRVISKLEKVQVSIDSLLTDIEDDEINLSDEAIAANYLVITSTMNFSFYPLSGTFDQLISTGSFELIESIELRRLLMNNYTHLAQRNNANNRSLDDLWLSFIENVNPFITVIPKIDEDASYIYADQTIDAYDIDHSFYLSKAFRAYLISAKGSVSTNLDMLDLFERNYNQIISLAEEDSNRLAKEN